MKVTLLIPTLNEEVGMRTVMPKVDRSLFHQILVVDGKSKDKTVEVSREMGYDVVIQETPGIRGAYMDALPHITGDAILTFSPDGNSIPELLKPCIDKFQEGYDMVIASRYLGNAKSDDDDIITAFGNWMFTKTINILHGGHYTDAMVIYRAYKTTLAFDLELAGDSAFRTPEKLFNTKVSWEPLLSIRAARRKLKITEIPGDEPVRIGGVRKLQIIRWGATFLYQILHDLFFWR